MAVIISLRPVRKSYEVRSDNTVMGQFMSWSTASGLSSPQQVLDETPMNVILHNTSTENASVRIQEVSPTVE